MISVGTPPITNTVTTLSLEYCSRTAFRYTVLQIRYDRRTTTMRGCRRINGLFVLAVICFNVVAFVYFSFDVNRDAHTTMKPNLTVWSRFAATDSTNVDSSDACARIVPLDPAEVPGNRSIFFIETTRKTAVELTARQACSVESAARINPNRPVYVLFMSPMFECQNGTTVTAAFSLVKNYHNVRFRHIDMLVYTNNTPFQDFVRTGVMEHGNWPVEQHSDMLRILTLWKFGGIYMDLDVVSLKPMPLINFIGAEYPGDMLASCVIGMQRKDVAERAIQMFKDGWDGENWVKNGPFLLTNLMKEQCGVVDVPHMYSEDVDCNNFTVYPPETFGPIAWYDWEILFNSSKNDFVKDAIRNSMAVHFWNKMTKEQSIIPKSNQPYANIANDNCPKVFNTIIDYF